MPLSTTLTRALAIERYTEIAHRLPEPRNLASTRYVANLSDLVDDIDVYVLDGFGVLNVGETTVPGAVERVAELQELGKQVLVLTNGATLPVERTVDKYQQWGMNFQLDDVISSRNALENAVRDQDSQMHWGVIAPDFAQVAAFAPNHSLLGDNPDAYDAVDGFVFLSAMEWTHQRQQLLHASLARRTRPVLVGNPDLVAPREDAMSMEPGLYTHELADAGVCQPDFYGKPFKDVFDLVATRISDVPPNRIAMVGDTLHTDILGGASYGWRTVLIKDHGLMKEADSEETFLQTGIRPDFVAATT